MRQEYSRTAEAMAFLRALEQHQPAGERIIDDPYAAAFLLNSYYPWVIKRPWAVRWVTAFLRTWAPGGQELLTIRPRLVDDLIKAEAANGLQQVVILGAGFDTHAWRCREVLRDVTVFEIDHPATQQAKREQSAQLGLPGNVRFVAVDFEKDDFAERLLAAGFDPARSTFFVWVGVSYYLTAPAVADTLQRIASLSRSGTKLVWDYMLADVVDGTSTNREALAKARRVAQLGEPWLFGVATNAMSMFLTSFGFRLLKDYEPAELQADYAPNRQLPMSYVRMVVCEKT
jgi:methyltransferase (TIGR00027 family)